MKISINFSLHLRPFNSIEAQLEPNRFEMVAFDRNQLLRNGPISDCQPRQPPTRRRPIGGTRANQGASMTSLRTNQRVTSMSPRSQCRRVRQQRRRITREKKQKETQTFNRENKQKKKKEKLGTATR